MDLTPHIQALRDRLEDAAGDDDATLAVARRLSDILEAALTLQVLDLLGQAALELSDQLPHRHVELRLAGRDVHLVVAEETVPPGPPDDGAPARLTLRMSESLKAAVEAAATGSGVSTNAWLVASVKHALDTKPPRRRGGGHRLTGYAQG
jgi:hypothetical protein